MQAGMSDSLQGMLAVYTSARSIFVRVVNAEQPRGINSAEIQSFNFPKHALSENAAFGEFPFRDRPP